MLSRIIRIGACRIVPLYWAAFGWPYCSARWPGWIFAVVGFFLALPFAATMTILLYLRMSEHGAARRTECGAEGDGERLGDRDTHRLSPH
jgi:hypothetical protein